MLEYMCRCVCCIQETLCIHVILCINIFNSAFGVYTIDASLALLTVDGASIFSLLDICTFMLLHF